MHEVRGGDEDHKHLEAHHEHGKGNLVAQLEHHRMMLKDYKRRLIVTVILTVPLLLISPEVQGALRFTVEFPGRVYALMALSTAIYVYGGKPFLVGLYREVKGRSPGMMTLVGVAISVAYFYSMAATILIPGRTFFWELATLIDIMLLGHWVEMKSLLGASNALEKLAKALPSKAHLLVGEGGYIDVDVAKIKPGDKLLVKPGEKVPVDGVIVEGRTSLDEALITGESKPVYRGPGDKVIAGTINLDGTIVVKAVGVGKDTYLSQVIELVKKIQMSKSKVQDIADRAAKWLTLIALTSGAATFTAWFAAGFDTLYALERAVTVMIITCPHALGLAIPLVIARSTAISASNGILVRKRVSFEVARNIQAVIFDKTGTLTEGRLGVEGVIPLKEGYGVKEVIRVAASLEHGSNHPIAEAIVKYAEEAGIKYARPESVKTLPGIGVEGLVDGQHSMVVGPTYLKEVGINVPKEVSNAVRAGKTAVYVIVNNELVGAVILGDVVREESREAIAGLKEMGIKPILLTGDNRYVAEHVARELGIDEYYAEVLPHEKASVVRKVRGRGLITAMVGDGINDAPAIIEADVGIAIGAGTDVAIESADIILVKNDPRDVLKVIELSRRTYRKIKQNLAWAVGYNAFAIPAAAGVFYWAGFLMPPALGALLMSLSTVIVAINASLLK